MAKTLAEFFNQVCPAFIQNNIPDSIYDPSTGQNEPVGYPRLTYTLETEDYYVDGNMQVRIYTKESGLKKVAELTDKLDSLLGEGVSLQLKEGGYLHLRQGSPFNQFIIEDEKEQIKSAYINITYQNIF